MRNPTRIADRIIDELGITSVSDLKLLEEIVFQRHAIIQRECLNTAEARLVIGTQYSIITVSTTTREPRRERFSIAHELGHLEMHRHEGIFPCSSDEINDWGTKQSNNNLETEANEFAAALLLPKRFFAAHCVDTDPSMDVIKDLSQLFNVSIMATARRYVQFCYEPVAVVWSQKRYIKWFCYNEAFADQGFFVNTNSLVDDTTVAGRIFDGQRPSKKVLSVRASAWMLPGHFRDILIQEQCIAMPSYEGVLSLLWFDDDDLENDDSDDEFYR